MHRNVQGAQLLLSCLNACLHNFWADPYMEGKVKASIAGVTFSQIAMLRVYQKSPDAGRHVKVGSFVGFLGVLDFAFLEIEINLLLVNLVHM